MNSDGSVAQPEDARTRLTKLLNARRFRDALSLSNALRREAPADGWLASVSGFASLRLGLVEQAVAAAADARRLGHGEVLTLFTLGAAQQRLGRHAEAVEALQIARRQAPDHVEIATLLIEATAAAYGLEAARPVFAEAAASLPAPVVRTTWARLLFRAGLDSEVPPLGLMTAPLMSVRRWALGAGVALDWSGEPEPIPVEDPVAFGESQAPSGRRYFDSYAPYVCTLRGATIFSRSNMVLMPDGAVLNDTAADALYGRDIEFTDDLLVADRREDDLLLATGRYRPAPRLEAGIMLSGSASQHFGHWVGEYLVKLRYLSHHPDFARLPIIVDEQMPAQHFEYLARIVQNSLIRLPPDSALTCERLIVASPSTFFPVHLKPDHKTPDERHGGTVPDCYRFIRDRALANMPPPSGARRKIYLSRSRRGGRRPLNEAEISAALTAVGFEIVFPEDLNFADQIRLFQETEVVVAANGSSLFNAFFAPTDAKLIVLSQRDFYNWGTFLGLMRELGHNLTFVCDESGRSGKHANYYIPVPTLLAAVESGTPAR